MELPYENERNVLKQFENTSLETFFNRPINHYIDGVVFCCAYSAAGDDREKESRDKLRPLLSPTSKLHAATTSEGNQLSPRRASDTSASCRSMPKSASALSLTLTIPPPAPMRKLFSMYSQRSSFTLKLLITCKLDLF
jgi:hypothetical protein